LDAVEAGLGTAPPSALGFKDDDNGSAEEKATLEIENGVHQLETLINATIDKNFDTMELYALRNILNIPEDLRDWIKLRHYEVRYEVSLFEHVLIIAGSELSFFLGCAYN
jgi:kinetochore protein Mis12/MTW1